jgi:hypothetical protein
MPKKNCWEYKHCGREPGGAKAEILGVCTASTERNIDGANSGQNGGRVCWAIGGTLCGGEVKGTFATKFEDCINCDFFKLVCKEEEQVYRTLDVLKKLAEE